MKISNASLMERLSMVFTTRKSRIEIVSFQDIKPIRKLRKFSFYVANKLSEEHPDLKIIDVFKTNDPFNFQHPLLWGVSSGYAIIVPRSYDLFKLKKTCISLELDENGKRICDIDVYETIDRKISRTDIGYKKW